MPSKHCQLRLRTFRGQIHYRFDALIEFENPPRTRRRNHSRRMVGTARGGLSDNGKNRNTAELKTATVVTVRAAVPSGPVSVRRYDRLIDLRY